MKDIIKVNLGKDHVFNTSNKTIGRSNENIITQFEITLDESLVDYWFYLDFILPSGASYKTSRLGVNENVVKYDIPNALLGISGTLKVQAVLQKESGEVWKSTIESYKVNQSINASDDIPNKDDFITNAQKTLDHLNSIEQGKSATIQIGEVETLESYEKAYVENVGNEKDAIFKLGIPRGYDGRDAISNYENLENLPSINDVELKGNKSLEDLGIQPISKEDIDRWNNPEIPDTLYALGADYAEYFEWEDGNPNNEDRRCLFVSIVYGTKKIKKAMMGDDVLGITSIDASVIGNARYKDETTYSSVGMMGIMKIKDNGMCQVGDYVIPGNDGLAIPSTNNAGYKVTARYSEDLIEVLLAHDSEIISRIKSELNELGNELDDLSKATPTKTSELENDSGFITENDIPDVDLSNYYNKDEIDLMIGDIESVLNEVV